MVSELALVETRLGGGICVYTPSPPSFPVGITSVSLCSRLPWRVHLGKKLDRVWTRGAGLVGFLHMCSTCCWQPGQLSWGQASHVGKGP